MAKWRLSRYPDPTSSFTDDQRAALVEADRQAAQRWREVTPPPGADRLGF